MTKVLAAALLLTITACVAKSDAGPAADSAAAASAGSPASAPVTTDTTAKVAGDTAKGGNGAKLP